MDIVTRIKQKIKEKGSSVAAVERELGFGNGTISKWSKQSPSCNNLLKLADYLNCTVDYLLTGKDVKNALSDNARRIVELFDDLTPTQQGEIIGRAALLAEQNEAEYRKDSVG